MKNSLLTSTILLSLSSPLFADFLSDNLIDGGHYKDIPSARTQTGRSALYSQDYPKIGTVVHSYHHQPIATPFSGEIPEASVVVPQTLARHIGSLRAQGYNLSYAFIVQGVELSAPHTANFYSLKPQYWLFPNAQRNGQVTEAATVRWTAIKGVVGNVDKAYQPSANLVSIHPSGVAGTQNVLSGDSLHLQGITHGTTVDSYDLVVNDARKQGVLTYHWLLNPALLGDFQRELRTAATFQNLLINLAVNTGGVFANLMQELGEYIGTAARPARPANLADAYFPPIPLPPAPPVVPARPAPVVHAVPLVFNPFPTFSRGGGFHSKFGAATNFGSFNFGGSRFGSFGGFGGSRFGSFGGFGGSRFGSFGGFGGSRFSSYGGFGGSRFGFYGFGGHRFGSFGLGGFGSFGGFRPIGLKHRFAAFAA